MDDTYYMCLITGYGMVLYLERDILCKRASSQTNIICEETDFKQRTRQKLVMYITLVHALRGFRTTVKGYSFPRLPVHNLS